MSAKKVLQASIPLAVFILLLGLFWQGLYRNPHEIPSPLINQPLPSISATSLIKPHQQLDNHLFNGQLTLLHVWGSWCGNCRLEHEFWMGFSKHSTIQLVGLDYKESRSQALSWLQDVGNPYVHILYDPTGRVATDLGVYGVPETFLIDAHQTVRYKHVGPMTLDVWHREIEPRIAILHSKQSPIASS